MTLDRESPAPLKVAYLVNQYPKVSHSFIRREIQALERQGVDVMRLAIRGWADEAVDDSDRHEKSLTRYVLQGGVPALLAALAWVMLRSPMRFVSAFALATRLGVRGDRALPYHWIYLAEACVIRRWLANAGVAHLHAHFGTNPAEVALLVHALGGPRYSFTVHGPEEFDRPQALGLGEKIRRAAFVAAISSYGRSQLFRWVGHEHWGRIRVVHCGLEPAFHAGALPPEGLRSARLVCVGRLCEQKGQLLLLDAAAILHRRGIEFELVLAGDGEMRTEVERAIARDGLAGKVTITGWISSSQVRGQLLAARALVLPSFAEGLPVVIMEAMALTRPVISTFVAGIPELIRPGLDGWLVPAGDAQALADAMAQCLSEDVESLARMGQQARERALARHDVDAEALKLRTAFGASHSVPMEPAP